MKVNIYDKIRKRYLGNDELKEYFFYNGVEHQEHDDSWEETQEFRLNLLTMKVQLLVPLEGEEHYQDSDDFEVSLDICLEGTPRDIESVINTFPDSE